MKYTLLTLFILLLILAQPAPARADGIIIPDPPICVDRPCPPVPCPGPFRCPPPSPMAALVIRYHHVTVRIQDQVAVTHVDQIFYNPNQTAVEGTYLFPLPRDAAVTSFTLWIDNQPVQGKVLDAEQARQTYRQIVNQLRDPALLEYAGQGAVQAHIFPIPPQGERRIELEYTQALTAENGLVRYVYPLSTEKFSAWPIKSVSVSLDIQATQSIRAVYSPSHTISLRRDSETHVTASYESADSLPDADFALYYSIGESQAFHLVSYRDPQDTDPDGYFLLLLAPQPSVESTPVPKDILFVIDHSGSMDGEKLQQAQKAMRYILNNLNPEDRFNIVAFNTALETYAADLCPAAEATNALPWVDQLSAQGSTDIHRALLEAAAMADIERPTYLIFLTDGLPTAGVTDRDKILNEFLTNARANIRLFAFGVGYDVDTFLLDSLSQEHHGASSYVQPGERLDEVLSAFYARISTPLLTDLKLDFGSLSVYDLYPSPLPDLFRGSQILAVGRYRQGGATEVTLTGSINGQTQTFRYPDQLFSTDAGLEMSQLQTAIPRLWATRKIGYLLNQIRLKGLNQETIDQIVHLSIRFGIVTPYTSYLVTENAPLGADQQERIAREQYNQLQAQPTALASGPQAVQKAAEQALLAGAQAPAPSSVETSEQVRLAGWHTFVLRDGKWIDTAYDPDSMHTTQVNFLSDAYYQLVEAHPELAAAFSLGSQVIALSGSTAYEVVPSGAAPLPTPSLTPTQTPRLEATPVQPTAQSPTYTPTSVPLPGATTQPSPTTQAPASPNRPCLGGFLPLALLGLGWVAFHRLRQAV